MAKVLNILIIFSIPLLSHSNNGLRMRLTPLDNIRNNVCKSCTFEGFNKKICRLCQVFPKGDPKTNSVQPPFSIKYGLKENGSQYNVKLQLNKETFDLEVSSSVISNSHLPFWQCRFHRNHTFRIYALTDFQSTDNVLMHYFVRDDKQDKFYYLKRLGHMFYDNAEQKEGGPVFSVLGSGLLPNENRMSYYQLKDNSLHCIKGECLKKSENSSTKGP